jgi:putative FmdB family regulatory protein
MPVYVYKCEKCGAQFEEIQRINDEQLIKCKNCGKKSLHRVIMPTMIAVGQKTIGMLAEKNSNRLSSEEFENIKEAQRTKRIDEENSYSAKLTKKK